MNRLQKKIITIALALSNIVLTSVVTITATYAWFTANKATVTTNSAVATIRATSPDDNIDYKIYKYDDSIKAGREYTDTTYFSLPDYDQYITSRNIYANVIIRAEISVDNLSTTDNEFVVNISRLASQFKIGGAVQSFTSNVAQFKAVVTKYMLVGDTEYTVNSATVANIDETSAATKYATASSYFSSKTTPTTFVPIRDNIDGTSIITRKSEADTIHLVPALPTGLTISKVVIYMECSYHQKLVDEYLNTNQTAASSYHSLSGDINDIAFSHGARTSNISNATGRYIQAESDLAAASGQYLPTYESAANAGYILKGENASVHTTPGASTGINARPNYKSVSIKDNVGNIPQSIDSTDDIDSSAFEYLRNDGTFKSKAGQYIGRTDSNHSATGFDSDSTSTDLDNTVYFENGKSKVKSNANTETDGRYLQFYKTSGSEKFGYFNNTQQDIDLYRYTENASEMPTVVRIEVDHSSATKTYYTGQIFNISGLKVWAYYSDGGAPIDVSSACTFSSSTNPKTLIPGTTQFNTAEASKTITINYKEGTFEDSTNSFTIAIIQRAVSSLSVTGSLSKRNYFISDSFSNSGITKVTANFNDGSHEDVTSSATYNGYNMSTAGTYTVYVNYSGVSLSLGNITVFARQFSISKTSFEVETGSSETLTLTYNCNVDISSNNDNITFSPSSVTFSGSAGTTSTQTVTVNGITKGTSTLTFTGNGTTKTCTITIKEVPPDSFVVTSNEIVSNSNYSKYSGTSADGNKSFVITYGGNNISVGTNSGNRGNCNLSSYSKYAVSPVTTSSVASAFASTQKLNGISKIEISHSGGSNNESTKLYVIYSTDNTTFQQVPLGAGSIAQGESISTTDAQAFIFDKAYSGYFAIVFVATNDSGNWRIDNVELKFNPKSLSSIALSGTPTKTNYNIGETFSSNGLTVTATYSDGTNANVTSECSFTYNPPTIGSSTTSVQVTASYTFAGSTETATQTYNISVNKYTVTFAANGGSGSMSPVQTSGNYSLPACGFTAPSGKQFDKWQIGGSYYDVDAFYNVTSNVTVTATWKNAAAEDTIQYALTTNVKGSNNSYDGNCDVTVNGKTWNVNGNAQMDPWRFGGKSITNVDRTLYSKTAIAQTINKVELLGYATGGSITLNSAKLVVSTAQNGGGTVIDTITASVSGTTYTFLKPSGHDWTGKYYKFVFNVTVSGGSNKYISFTGANFWGTAS